MSNWLEDLNEMQHYYALRNEAEQHRLARQALAGQPVKPNLYCRLMSWSGCCLSAIGNKLQERYGKDAPALILNVETRKPE